jgi:hypothetical protein
LKKNRSNKNICSLRFHIPLVLAVLFISSCNPTKYVPRDESLLDETHIIINREGIKKESILPFIKQKPNKRIFYVKFYLGLYNLSNIKKDKWPHTWLRNIGEEPVIFDPYATEKSKEQIQSYIASKGYFDSHVMETIETENRKTKVFFNIDLNTPYTIKNIYYEIADTNIRKLFYFDSVNCMIERGKPYDIDVLQAERSRFERYVKDHGFYAFSGDHISFAIDSTAGDRKVNIFYRISQFTTTDITNRSSIVPHSRYMVRNIYIYPDFVPKDALEGGDAYLKSLDTIKDNGYYFITPKKRPDIKYDLIIQSLYLKPGSIYNVTNTEQTQSHLLALKIYRLVNIFYNEVHDQNAQEGSILTLDCTIQLTTIARQSFKVEVEGTNTGGSLGGDLNLIYQNGNLFHGAEIFNLKLKGAYEAISQKDSLRGSQEYAIETSLRFPKFLVPFIQTEGFIKKYNPSTTVLAAYDYQNMPFYNRTLANATFGYTWNQNKYITHIVNPIQLDLVKLVRIDSSFKAMIDTSSYLAYSYRNVMILGGGYSFIYNDQKIKKSRYWFVRVNAETSGNIAELASKLIGTTKTNGSYNILGQPFAQYFRADADIRYNVILNDASSAVYRVFIGAGIPYGNSEAMPFEKQYYGGGANDIRAWQVRTLGPGSYIPPSTTSFLNQTADIKLVGNAEYRFKLFWILHGAFFLDAGNIWSFNDDPTRPGAQFVINNFYKDIAVGTGTGLRFDFGFVLMRADLGLKLRDPSISYGSKWIILSRPYSFRNDVTLVIAIGYPF